MLGDAVAEREQAVGKVDVFKENVAAELDIGEVPDALYTEGDETVGDLLCDAFGHRQHRDGGVIGGAVGVQLVHPANGDAVYRGADDGGGNVEGGVEEKAALVELDPQFLSRSLNEGFSGGEKKRAEIFQMAALQPRLAILDETDSGLDIDALRIVASGVNRLKSPENATIVITHYQRLLDYIVPDYVHVLYKGRIIRTGDKSLALELEKRGYDWLIKDEN